MYQEALFDLHGFSCCGVSKKVSGWCLSVWTFHIFRCLGCSTVGQTKLRVGQIRIEAAWFRKSFLGKAHFRVQPVGFSAFFFKMAQVGVLQQRPSAALSCNFAADVCPVFITDISFLSAVFPCASPLPCDGSGWLFFQQLWKERKKKQHLGVNLNVFVKPSNFLPLR